MHTHDPTHAAPASWSQLELAVERLHAAARAPISIRDFYRQLLADASAALGAVGAAAWRPRTGGPPELICQSFSPTFDHDIELADRRTTIDRVATTEIAAFYPLPGRVDGGPAPNHEWLVCPVRSLAPGDETAAASRAAAVIELWLPPGADPLVQQGSLDFATTLADVAADFHALDELRRLRHRANLAGESIDVLRRVQDATSLSGAAFAAANEGRRVLGCDRLSVVIRRGHRWRLAAVSGVDRAASRTEFAHRIQRLADQVSRWGEPIARMPLRDDEPPAAAHDDAELAPPLALALEEHLDHSHARELVAAPASFAPREAHSEQHGAEARPRPSRRGPASDVVFIAEQFEAGRPAVFVSQVTELAQLTAPALARASELDRFPLRTALGWSRRLASLTEPRRMSRAALVSLAIVAAIVALVFVPCDFDVESPATLSTLIERDVFATATGAVSEIRVQHGQQVAKGDLLAVLSDPDLALQLQQTRGEIDATRQRLDALAVARTERNLREHDTDDRLPLSAEQRQLEERLAGLDRQLKLLESRTAELTLRSPRAGQVLTRDVQSLLESRPVERGQVLLSIADPSSGWQLVADVPERDIGHLLEAQSASEPALSVTYRLAGDVQQSYPAHVTEVAAAAVLDAEGLEDAAPPVKVRIAIDGPPPVAARPGMTASVRIHCGRRSLGYVWLHDVGATLYRWATF